VGLEDDARAELQHERERVMNDAARRQSERREYVARVTAALRPPGSPDQRVLEFVELARRYRMKPTPLYRIIPKTGPVGPFASGMQRYRVGEGWVIAEFDKATRVYSESPNDSSPGLVVASVGSVYRFSKVGRHINIFEIPAVATDDDVHSSLVSAAKRLLSR
jgi:hypothetical protein